MDPLSRLPVELSVDPQVDPPLVLRRARRDDVPAVVELLAADQLGATRDGVRTDADLSGYVRAFDAVDADPGELLVVAEHDGDVVGTLQLSVLPGLARRGALRAQVEAVRVRSDRRGRGVGRAMLDWAVAEARARGCALVQLTSDKRRPEAHRLYQRLGFVDSHEGFKLHLDSADDPDSHTPPRLDLPLAVGDHDPDLDTALDRALTEHNMAATGVDEERAFSLRADDADGLVAGLSGWTWGRCAGIGMVWVRGDRRGAGWGGRLLAAAEEVARDRGCDRIYVSSFTFQAPGFYAAHGYSEIARVEGLLAEDAADVWFVKRLQAR